MARVFVTGTTGSGKTTLARLIAAQAGLHPYSLDDIHWIRHPEGDWRRSPDERAALLDHVAQQETWVIEGVQFKWADTAMDRAHHFLVLVLPRWRNLSRIGRRFADRLFSHAQNSRRSAAAFWEELQWSTDYYEIERALLFSKLRRWQDKVIIARDSRSAISAISTELRHIRNID